MKQQRYSLGIILFLSFVCTSLIDAATVDTVLIYSKTMQKEIKAVVVLPDREQKTQQIRYPVLYLLHGWRGSYRDWSNHTNLKPLVETYQLIIVCPDGGYAGWYLDSPINKDSQYETYLAREVVQHIDKHYPTLADSVHRAICGLSMGGHGAISLICKYPDVFGAASSMSGVMTLDGPNRRAGLKDVLGSFESNQFLWGKNSCLYLVYKLRKKNKALLFDCGTEDFCLDSNRRIHQKLLELNIAHEYYERSGGHNWEYWVNALEYHLLFFKKFWSKPLDQN